MTKAILLIGVTIFSFSVPARALTLESFPAPTEAQNLVDPDENLRILPFSGPNDPQSGPRSPRSGFSFGFSGSPYPSGNRQFIPGYTVPGQYGPAIDPQTKDPYPR
jgi:hypothetical protein